LARRKAPSVISEEVAPFNRYLGVFLPYTPLHYLLLAEGGFKALVMTSGNLSEEPIAIDNREAVEAIEGWPTASWCITATSFCAAMIPWCEWRAALRASCGVPAVLFRCRFF
jgi:tRNA A37 threonylcarbamoyladenosine synthetase subunit TsaC/SUA5/YrdC